MTIGTQLHCKPRGTALEPVNAEGAGDGPCPWERPRRVSQHTGCTSLAQTHRNLILASHDF